VARGQALRRDLGEHPGKADGRVERYQREIVGRLPRAWGWGHGVLEVWGIGGVHGGPSGFGAWSPMVASTYGLGWRR
jgi:hypothetical protein